MRARYCMRQPRKPTCRPPSPTPPQHGRGLPRERRAAGVRGAAQLAGVRARERLRRRGGAAGRLRGAAACAGLRCEAARGRAEFAPRAAAPNPPRRVRRFDGGWPAAARRPRARHATSAVPRETAARPLPSPPPRQGASQTFSEFAAGALDGLQGAGLQPELGTKLAFLAGRRAPRPVVLAHGRARLRDPRRRCRGARTHTRHAHLTLNVPTPPPRAGAASTPAFRPTSGGSCCRISSARWQSWSRRGR
jgi:hypothetical protein